MLNPGAMRGPNHPTPAIDALMNDVKPLQWRNVALPVAEGIERILKCLVAFQEELNTVYNDGIRAQRVVNMVQAMSERSHRALKREVHEEITLVSGELQTKLNLVESEWKRAEAANRAKAEKELKEYVEDYVERVSNESVVQVKDWSRLMVTDQVRQAS